MCNDTSFNSGAGEATSLLPLLTKGKKPTNVPDSSSLGYCDITIGKLGQHVLTSNQCDISFNHNKALTQHMVDFSTDPKMKSNGPERDVITTEGIPLIMMGKGLSPLSDGRSKTQTNAELQNL